MSITRELDEKIVRLALAKGLLNPEALQQVDAEITREMRTVASDEWSPRIEILIEKGLLDDSIVVALKAEVLSAGGGNAESLDQRTAQIGSVTDSDFTRADEKGRARKSVNYTFGRYERIEFLGEGGMAQVYRAYDPSLDRMVALKFLRMEDPKLAERLMNEARSQARIEHQHVCKVYEVGNVSGTPYIAMQYIKGETFRSFIPNLPTEQKVRLMKDVCEAVHAAHRAGLIHRDLKPGNVMIERNADGRLIPYVMDFGVARDIATGGITMDGAVIGSAWYMPPEQARGEIQKLDRRSDVYSLGATLYEVLSGRLPFETASSVETLLKVINEEPVPLNKRNPQIPDDLVTIVHKCMEKEPSRRYDSARALAEDLGRFLEGEPLLAKSTGPFYRLYRKARKNKTVTLTIIAALVSIAIMAGSLIRSRWEAQRQIEFAGLMAIDVAQMENIMRQSYLWPLHDVVKEKNKVRTLMKNIQSRIQQAGTIADAPGSYALGRGYLILNNAPKAKQYLERAWQIGYQRPEVAYALGLVYGRLYQQELPLIVKISNQEQREIQRAKMREKYLRPALDFLNKGRGAELESSDYVRALILYYQEQNDKALMEVAAGRRKSPEIYEFDLLEGDIHRYFAGAAFSKGDFSKAEKETRLAEEKYRGAANFARSDSRAYSGLCDLGSDIVQRKLYGEGGDISNDIKQSLETCRVAIAADSENATSYAAKSYIYRYLAESQMNSGQDPDAALHEAVLSGKQAILLDPNNGPAHASLATAALYQAENEIGKGKDPQASLDLTIREARLAVPLMARPASSYNVMANAYAALGEYQMSRGVDPRAALQSSIEGYQQALKLNPKFSAPYNNIASVYRDLGVVEMRQGKDPSAMLHKALDNAAEATRLKPNDAYPITESGQCYNELAKYALDTDRDPSEFIQKAIENLSAAARINPEYPLPPLHLAEAFRLSASHAIIAGFDPAPLWQKAEATIQQAWKINPSDAEILNQSALIRLDRAEYYVQKKNDASLDLKHAGDDLNKALEIDPTDSEAYIQKIRILILRIRASGTKTGSEVKDAAEYFKKAIAVNPANADAYLAMAQLDAAVAEALRQEGDSMDAVRDGLAHVERALQIRKGWSKAAGIRARLLDLQARK